MFFRCPTVVLFNITQEFAVLRSCFFFFFFFLAGFPHLPFLEHHLGFVLLLTPFFLGILLATISKVALRC